MMIIGCDFHPSWQQIVWLDTETGETGEHKLVHAEGEAQRFYQKLTAPVLIGMEATGNSQWFIELVEDLGHEIWIGDAAQIRASYVRKQKMLRELPLKPWAACRREDLLGLLAMLNQQIGKLDDAVQQAAEENPQAKLLMTQPGVGPNTALAYVLTIGDVSRFPRGKQVASYLGLIPREESSGGRQKLGAISKQGNRMLRMLLVEAVQTAVRLDPGLRKEYLHRCHQKPKAVAKVAAARKLAVRLYWMLRTQKPYPEVVRIESSPRVRLVGEN